MTEFHLSEGEQFVLRRLDRLEDKTDERFAGISKKVTGGFDGINRKLDNYFEVNDERVINLRIDMAKVAVITSIVTSMLTVGAVTFVTKQLKKTTVIQTAIMPPKQRGR